MSQFSNEEGMAILGGAFRPLRCGVDDFDYGRGAKFRVFGPDDTGILSMPEVPAHILQSPADLKELIEEARARIKAKGFALEPWTLPTRTS